jgi:hypothetical protein
MTDGRPKGVGFQRASTVPAVSQSHITNVESLLKSCIRISGRNKLLSHETPITEFHECVHHGAVVDFLVVV